MLGYIYETTCLKTGKIYVGCKFGTPEHTKSYLGSGKILEQAVNKYGKENFAKNLSEKTKKKISDLRKGISPSEASNKKRSETLKGRPCPNKGKIWITNGIKNTCIYSEQLEEYLKKGFYKGRKIPLKEYPNGHNSFEILE